MKGINMTKVMIKKNNKTAATKENKTLTTKELKALRKKIKDEAKLSSKDLESLTRAIRLRSSEKLLKDLSEGKTKALWELTKTLGRLIEADTAYARQLIADKSFDAAVGFTTFAELRILKSNLNRNMRKKLRDTEDTKVSVSQKDIDLLASVEARAKGGN
jgi:hypothetical protein